MTKKLGGLAISAAEIEERRTVVQGEAEGSTAQVREIAARLYGQGFRRSQIARILEPYLLSEEGRAKRPDWRRKMAIRRLQRWENQQSFRDMVWNSSIIKLDMATPSIMNGLAASARRGRVDAAKLALELTGRYQPKGDLAPTQIALVVNGIPRPMPAPLEMPQAVRAVDLQNE